MAAKPIPTFLYSPKPSFSFTKIPFQISSNPFRSSWSSLSLSRTGSFAIKCINGNANGSSDQRSNVKNLFAGLLREVPNSGELETLLSGITDELLKKDQTRAFFDSLNKAFQNVDVEKIIKQDIKMRKMKQYISWIETRVVEIEKGHTEVSEARALVEEAKHFLQVEFGDQNSMKSETESCESEKVPSISDLIDALNDVSLH